VRSLIPRGPKVVDLLLFERLQLLLERFEARQRLKLSKGRRR